MVLEENGKFDKSRVSLGELVFLEGYVPQTGPRIY